MKQTLALGVMLAAIACAKEPAPEQTADSICFGGAIITMNADAPEVEAVAVRDGRVVDMGTFKAMHDAHAGTLTRMIDLHGGTMVPGVVDEPESANAETVTALVKPDPADAQRRIAIGETADFVILDRNPLEAGGVGNPAVRVMRTIRAGETVFRAQQ